MQPLRKREEVQYNSSSYHYLGQQHNLIRNNPLILETQKAQSILLWA